jgi:hypothetical protein
MTVPDLVRSARRGPLALLATALLATLLVVVWMGIGALSLPGVLLGLLALGVGGLLVLVSAPSLAVVAVPALLPFGLVWAVFPYELALGVVFVLALCHGIMHRATWLVRLEPLEVANLAFVAWALFTGFWSEDGTAWALGARRYLEGVVSLWVGLRLVHLVPRRAFEYSIVLGTMLLAIVSLRLRFAAGIGEAARLDRASATDLGWATSNFIATLLLLLLPPILTMAWRSRDRLLRLLAVACVVVGGVLQVLIASRAAAVLFAGGLFAQTWISLKRWRAMAVAAVVVALTGLLVSPLGSILLSRFQDVREMGSMVVRIWYFRTAWERTLDHFPWGMGLHQGISYPDRLQSVDPHNYWLTVSSELGVLGLLLWVVVLVELWRRIRAIAADPRWATEGRALLVAFVLVQLHTLVEPTFQGVQYQFVFFWTVGGYLGYFAASRRDASVVPARPSSSR